MKKVIIKPGCISCGRCEFVAPEIFEVTDIARVKDKLDQATLEKNKEEICQAIAGCPVQVISLLDQGKTGEKEN